jgi:hypothetical protein
MQLLLLQESMFTLEMKLNKKAATEYGKAVIKY